MATGGPAESVQAAMSRALPPDCRVDERASRPEVTQSAARKSPPTRLGRLHGVNPRPESMILTITLPGIDSARLVAHTRRISTGR